MDSVRPASDRDPGRRFVLNYPVPFKRFTLLTAVTAALLLFAPPALGRITELGQTTAVNPPSCPKFPCLAVSRTTGYQAKVGPSRGLFVAPRDGRIVAWTISLGKVGPKQRAFFEKNYGGPASAGLAILRPGKKLFARIVAQSSIFHLTKWFGQTVQFGLSHSLIIHKGEVVGVTVPTWAPALAVGLGNDTSWRASRKAKSCRDTQTQTAQQTVGSLAQYLCLYRTARLTYSATIVSTP